MTFFPDILKSPIKGLLITETKREELIFRNGTAIMDDVLLTLIPDQSNTMMHVSLRSGNTPIKWIILRFPCKMPDGTRIYGDQWERGYGDLQWSSIYPERHMPWYFLCHMQKITAGYGVMVRPHAMCSWQLDSDGITLYMDVRCGGAGVILNGKTLNAATIFCREYVETTFSQTFLFESAHHFCQEMCPDPIFPKEPVYGSNNWYYAYGVSSQKEILTDTAYLKKLTSGLQNRPYMVIDDGWQTNSCAGPWDRGNHRFPDMRALASAITKENIKPGLWVRLLYDNSVCIPPEWKLSREPHVLDPSVPAVLDHIKEDIKRFTDWGFCLIKHDYSTFDLFGSYGLNMGTSITSSGWCFADRSKTSAEIVLDFYQAIHDAAENKAIIIGCNTFSHLCAGLVEVNRTGDDTSGREWNRTRKMGVNTLAFRMMQNRAFYMADADCVGITRDVPWEQNRMWLTALSRSGSPLFISSAEGVADDKMIAEMKTAFRYNAEQKDILIPLDWIDSVCPEKWNLNGENVTFDWYPKFGALTI